MEFRQDVSFSLEGFSPAHLCALPSQACLVVVSGSGVLRSLDLSSGTQLHETEVLASSSPILCQHHQQSGKLVVATGGNLGARGSIGGSVLLQTILQPPVSDSENVVSIDISLEQSEVLLSELEGVVVSHSTPHSGGTSTSKQWSAQAASVSAQLARGVRKIQEKDSANGSQLANKWKNVSIEGPVQQLSSFFDDLLTKLKINRGGAGSTHLGHHRSSSSSTSPSPALPLVAAISLRLQLLHPDHHSVLCQLQGGKEMKDHHKLMYCEAIRRLSLRKWPHKNYVWAVPSTMAEAGFFHLANTNLASAGIYKPDRVSCFACHVYLYSWEPNDEPWSEHERHAMQCPFMRGDPTENVPLEVTEGTHPAVEVTSDPNDSVAFLASSSHSSLVGVATKQGVLSVWDVSGSLCIVPRARLELKVELLHHLLQTHLSKEQDNISSFSVTSLSLLSSSSDSPPVLVTAVTVSPPSAPSFPLLLLHSVVDAPPPGTSPPPPSKVAAPVFPSTAPHPPGLEFPPLDFPPLSDEIPFITEDFSPTYVPLIPPSTATTNLETLTDITDPPSEKIGSLQFLSLLPISEALLDHRGNYIVQLTHPLPHSNLLAVYVRTAPPAPMVVNDDTSTSVETEGDGPYGYLVIVRYSEGEEGRVCLCPEPVVKLVTMCQGDVIVDMCSVEADQREVMAVVTASGELQLLDVESLQVLASHTAPGGCGYCRCTAWNANGSWVAAATEEGRVEVMRVCDVKETESELTAGEGLGSATLENSLLTQRLAPALLDHLLSLTDTSPVGVAYTGSTPPHWQEISLQQYHRKVPTHMHTIPGDPSSESHAPNSHTRVWQYLPPPPVKKRAKELCSEYQFELSLNPSCPPLGCISVRLCLPNARCLSDTAAVSLLLPSRGAEGSAGVLSSRPDSEDPQVLCGPIMLKSLVDVTGCAVQASFTHPLLLSPHPPLTLVLILQQLFAVDYSEVVVSTAEAHTPSNVKTGGLRRRGCIVRHGGPTHRLQHHMNSKCRAVLDQCYLSLSLYPLSQHTRPTDATPNMDTLLSLMSKEEFLLNLTLAACQYHITKKEYDHLPPSLQAAVDNDNMKDTAISESQGKGGSGGMVVKSLQLLCWVSSVEAGLSDREGMGLLHRAVSQLILSLLYTCYFSSHSRRTAHYCTRLVISLYRPHVLSASVKEFGQHLLRALPPLLPLLPLCTSAACVQWFLRVVEIVAVKSHDQHMISQHCLELLVELARQLQSKSGPLSQLLTAQGTYRQDGSVLEDSLYDIYLSYYQRTTLTSLKTYSSGPLSATPSLVPLHVHQTHWGQPLASHPKLPPAIPAHLSSTHPSGTSVHGGPHLIYTERRSQTIYDAELKLLLNPPPRSPEQVKTTLAEFTPFQHGSFLLYSQRGLLETYPLEYTCCSVTGNASVQELVYQNTPSPSSTATATAPHSDSTRSSGYFYPSGPAGKTTLHHPMPSTSSQIPNELIRSGTFPKELVMHIDVLHSGQVYSAVLRFSQPVYLTDLSLSTNSNMGCVSVDVWGEEGERGAVRVAQCTEIQEKNLMLGNLTPPPLCQFVKVTYTGKLGAAREKTQAFLGSFYGIPLLPNPPQTPTTPLMPEILYPLEQRLLSEYHTARDKLTSSLTSSAAEKGPLKHSQDTVRERYQSCFVAQTRLARLRHYMRTIGSEEASVSGGVLSVEEETARVDFPALSLSQLYRLAGCLVNTLLILCGQGESEEAQPAPPSTAALPVVSEEECQLLLLSLCIHGILRVQARLCALLLRLCASQPWWGDVVVLTATSLFTSNHTHAFNKERAMLQLSALCQRSYQHSSVLTCLLHSLSSLLAPPLAPSSSDQQQLQWLVLLLSHTLSVLHSSSQGKSRRDPNLFGPTLNVPSTQPPPPPHTSQPTPQATSHTGGERRSAGSSRLGLRISSRRTAAAAAAAAAAEVDTKQPPVSSPPPPLPSLPFPLSHDVTCGLLNYILCLVQQQDWVMVSVVCKAISYLAHLSSHPLPLTSLLTSSQLTLLLSTACAPLSHHGNSISGNRSPSNTASNQQWACRAIQWMIMTLVYCGDIGPHLAQRERERGEGGEGEVVGQVEETDLPTKEEVEMLTREVDQVGETETKVESEAVGKMAADKASGEGALEDKLLPLHPQVLDWVSPGGQYGEHEYDLVNWMTDQDPLFSHPPVPPIPPMPPMPPVPPVAPLPSLYDLYAFPPSYIVTSDLKPVALSPPPVTINTPVTTATIPLLPKLNKPKKKLSKHHVKSVKYAPGDYTEVPVVHPADSNAAASSVKANPYRSFIISSALDHRLQHSVELPTELALQVVARAQYESVLQALVSAGPLEEGVEEGRGDEERGRGRGETGLENVCTFIQDCLGHLLGVLADPQPSVNKVALLQLWSEFNSLLMAWCPPPSPPVPSGNCRSKTSSDPSQSKVNVFPSFCSPKLLVSLTECLPQAPSTSATWQIGLSLFHQITSSLCSPTTSLPLHPSQLSHLLSAYFLSGDDLEVGVARDVVLDLLKKVVPMELVGTTVSDSEESKEEGEGLRGAHILLKLLVELLEQRPSLLDSPILYPLLEALTELDVPRLLFPPIPTPCVMAISCIHKLLVMITSLVHFAQMPGHWKNVLLHAADIDGDRMRGRYRTTGGPRFKWVPVPHGSADSTHRPKVTSELIQLVRQLLTVNSDTLPDCAHQAIQDFTSKDSHDPQPSSRHPVPLTSLVYGDPSLMSQYLSLLNSLTPEEITPWPPSGKAPPAVPSTSNFPTSLFVNFLHFLYFHCPDCTCFFHPILEALGSAGEDSPISRPFLHFVSRLTSDLAQDGNREQLDQFVAGGGARLVFECFVQSCQPPTAPSLSSSGSLSSTALLIGQQSPSRPFQEGSDLVNFLPIGKLQLTPSRASVQDLQSCSNGDPPSRSSTFHHTFQSREQELVMTASLPYPILFSVLQLFQPTGSLQNGPSSVLIETSSQPGLAPPLPVTPTINTKGLGSIKIELQLPVVAQEIKVHLYRPTISDSISFSHVHLLGVGYGGPPGENDDVLGDSKDHPHPSSSWLAITHRWLALPEGSQRRLLDEAAAVPQLLPTCLSLITTHWHTLSVTTSNHLLYLLQEMTTHYLDYSHAFLRHMMGFSSEATPITTPPAIELFHVLCVANTDQAGQRLSLCLKLLSSLTEPHSDTLPVLVRAVGSAVWSGDPDRVASLLSEDLFRSLAEVAISSVMGSPLKQAFNSLLCALCSHTPHHFTLLLDRCMTALNAATSPHLPPNLSPLLFTLAHTAQSPLCSPILLSSLLLTSITAELCSTFTTLVLCASADSGQGSGPVDDLSSLLQRSCSFLAFLTDFSRDWIPAKEWLGSGQQTSLWPPLLQFLSLAEYHHPHLVSPLELRFVQDVGIEFFQAVLQGSAANKTLFSCLLTNSIYGSYSLEKREVAPSEVPALTAFTYRLFVELVLDSEPVTVVLQPLPNSVQDGTPVALSLPLTHKTPIFHPSLPISQYSYIVSLPASVPISHLVTLCQPHPSTDDQRSKAAAMKQPQDPRVHVLSLKAFENKKLSHLHHHQKMGLQGSQKSEPKSILKAVSPSTQVSLSLPSSPNTSIPTQTKLSELVANSSSPYFALFLTVHTNKPPSSTADKDSTSSTAPSPSLPPPPSLLDAFTGSGGLVPLSLCLPSLYPHTWPKERGGEGEGVHSVKMDKTSSPLSLTATSNSLPHHALVTFGLCLRLRCYGDALMEHYPKARILLMMLMGAESKEPLSKPDSEQLPMLPYLLLLRLLRDQPAHEEVGVACREAVMREGVIHQVLASLSSFGHQPRTGLTPPAPSSTDDRSSSKAVSRPDHGMASGRHQYWAKGTGFGTGSTLSAWNVDAMRAKQKSEEKYICLCFAILSEYLTVTEGCGQGEESWCGPALADLLADSCLLPAMTTYLINDSILDISKHTELYQAALGLLYSLTSHPSLLPLLSLPVFSDRETPAGKDSLSLLSLSKKLKNTVLSYVKTAKLKTKTGASAPSKTTPNATPTTLPLPVPPRRIRLAMNTTHSSTVDEAGSAEAELSELISAMLATAERILSVTAEARGEGAEGEGEHDPCHQSSNDVYMETMKSIQFDTYQFLEEDEMGRLHFFIPFHYEGRLQSSTAAVYGAARARRLAQEVSALATSLPLSSSSSVFVRCDEDRLDVMKVLITGPSDTPYANGCFEFDVFFPAEYPQGPMLVNLMTTGQGTVRFNPNLYNDGKVCLSVLNTWHGRPEEKWSSENSSFLQVLVSIQSLVLVPDPYFNEPGYEQYRGTQYGDQKSLTYNANLYVATVQWAMLNQLQNPTPCFKEVVLRHFLLRREEVLSQCKVWERTLAEGIEKMQARGVATAHLKDYLHKLVKCVETLKVEISKIEKKLSQTVSDKRETTEASCPPVVISPREGMVGDPESKETTASNDSSPDGGREMTQTLDVGTTEDDAVVGKTMAEELESKSHPASSESHVTPPQPQLMSSEGHVTPPQPQLVSSECHVTPPQPQLVSSEGHVTPPQPGPSTPAIVVEEGGSGTEAMKEEGGSTVEPAAPTQHSCMSTDSQSGPQDHEQ